jgi:hypothetical protein
MDRMGLSTTRVRAVPWILVFQLAITLRRHYNYLTVEERVLLASLIRKSQGVPTRLTPRERADVRRLVRKLEPFAMARSVAPHAKRAVTGKR